MSEHSRPTRNRREFLSDAFCGFGGVAFAAMLAQEQARAADRNPLAPKAPQFPAKAKSVIFLFMAGGPSHLETFDPKPLLNRLNGQKRPEAFGDVARQFIKGEPKLLGTKRTFRQYGQSGLWVSDLLPHTATCADDLAVIRSCQADAFVHSAAQYQLLPGASSRLSEHGLVGGVRAGVGKRIATGLCGDARSRRHDQRGSRSTRTASCRRRISRVRFARAGSRC